MPSWIATHALARSNHYSLRPRAAPSSACDAPARTAAPVTPFNSLPCRAMAAETTTKQLYICTSCGFINDPDEGDPDGGVPPGTAFDDIPDDWFCPVCGARKADFEPYEE